MAKENNRDQRAYYEAATALRERQIQAKERMRKSLAAPSFTEKLKILEKLRDREKAMAAAGSRRNASKDGPSKP